MSVIQKSPAVSEVTNTQDFTLTENGRKVLEARYLKKNEAGECVEQPADLFHRVADCIADVELMYGASESERNWWSERFYHLMTSGDFMPNSPTLMNAGREMGMLSACFVLPVKDSIVDIFNSIKHTAMIQKAGGGTGFAFDELRPTGDFISSSGGTTSGPITFWRAFSEATNAIQQGAFRRGANMGMMYIHHPDILKFLHAKQDLTQFTNYNISVKITDNWMDEFRADPDSPQFVRNPRNGKAFVLPRDLDIWKYDIRNLIEVDCVEPISPAAPEKYYTTPRQTAALPPQLKGKVYTKREIWEIIKKNAHQTGEPGVVFIDRINEYNPTPHVGRIEATNPCGEQPLLPYEACNLGSINLGNFVREGCTESAHVDWDALRECVHQSTRFLDNVIDANNYPLPEIDNICKGNRKIGLGIMGFADALYKLNIAYNSEDGIAWGARFMQFVNDEAHNCGERLARTRGPFPNWKGSIWHTQHNRLMRNAATTTVAPTGTISIISNCSGGIEPMFSLAFIRNVLKGQKQGEKPLVEVNDTFLAVAKERGFYSEELIERIAREGSLAHIDEIPEDVKQVFVCAHDITPEWHMHMQAAFQDHCDSSISKTINFPHAATADDVEQIYHLAYELRCKGVTVYRDGCRACQPMALKKEEGKSEPATAVAGQPVSEKTTERATAPRPAASSEPRFATTVAARATAPSAAPAPAISNPHSSAAQSSAPSGAAAAASPGAAPFLEPMDLPEIVSGLRIRQMTPFGNMHVKITVDPRVNRELEVFAQLGKGGDVATSDLEAVCRMISLWLRSGGSLRHVIKQLEGIGSSLQIPTRAGRIMSLGDGLACALKKYMKAKERFGLRSLLLGEIDLAALDVPPAPHGAESHDRAPATNGANGHAEPRPQPTSAAAPAKAPANGHTNGAHAPNGASRIAATSAAPPAKPAAPNRLAEMPPVKAQPAARRPVVPAPQSTIRNQQSAISPQSAVLNSQSSATATATGDFIAQVPPRPALATPAKPRPRIVPPSDSAVAAADRPTAELSDAAFEAIADGLAADVAASASESVLADTMTAVVELEAEAMPRTTMETTLLADEEITGEMADPAALHTDSGVFPLRLPSDPTISDRLAGLDLPDAQSSEPGCPQPGLENTVADLTDAGLAAAEAALLADLETGCTDPNCTAADCDCPAADSDCSAEVKEQYLVAEFSADADPSAALTLNIDDLLKSVRHTHDSAEHYKIKCPQCEGALVLQEGCKICYGCGWSAC